MYKEIKNIDSELYSLISKEEKRREEGLELIPSENHTSKNVLNVLSSILNDKYAEGYPGKRYYGGCEIVDSIERLCQERAKRLFNVEYVNVQPYSGSPANHAVYFATMKAGDSVMGLDLMSGGHLTHGYKVNFSGSYYNSINYPVSTKGDIDFDQMLKLAKQKKPKLIWAGTTAYSKILDWAKFRYIADEVDAYLAADVSHIAGLIVSGVHPSPSKYVDIITTTTHKTLRGPRGGMIMVTSKGLKKDCQLPTKIDKAVFPGLQGGPHIHQIAGIAACLYEASTDKFKEYGQQIIINAKTLSESLMNYGFNIVSNGTENHLMVVDLRSKGISGTDAQIRLGLAGITVNKNTIPFDPNPPFNPSGIRIGTPAITTRGMKEKEMKYIANLIDAVITTNNTKDIEKLKEKVKTLCEEFPIR